MRMGTQRVVTRESRVVRLNRLNITLDLITQFLRPATR